jgi:hypothetical protein
MWRSLLTGRHARRTFWLLLVAGCCPEFPGCAPGCRVISARPPPDFSSCLPCAFLGDRFQRQMAVFHVFVSDCACAYISASIGVCILRFRLRLGSPFFCSCACACTGGSVAFAFAASFAHSPVAPRLLALLKLIHTPILATFPRQYF